APADDFLNGILHLSREIAVGQQVTFAQAGSMGGGDYKRGDHIASIGVAYQQCVHGGLRRVRGVNAIMDKRRILSGGCAPSYLCGPEVDPAATYRLVKRLRQII